MTRRTTKYTECNEHSSRSHAIYSLCLKTEENTSKIQFVDLAGSERVGKSGVSGESLKEALLINKSLSALQDVISALENKQKHVPYRNSVLTRLLQPTLGGSKSMVNMIVSCSPSVESLNETSCTLALASRVKTVDLGFFLRKNMKNKEVERTLILLEKERAEKQSLLRTLDKVQRDLESYQIAVKDRDNKISILNSKIKLKEKAYFEVRNIPKIENLKVEVAKKAVKIEDLNKNKTKNTRNLIHFNIKEVTKINTLSPTIKTVGSPKFEDKPSKIPGPCVVNLKIRHNN